MTCLSHNAEKAELSTCDHAASTKSTTALVPGRSETRFAVWFGSVIASLWLETDLDHLNDHILKDVGQSGHQPGSRRFQAARQARLPRHLIH